MGESARHLPTGHAPKPFVLAAADGQPDSAIAHALAMNRKTVTRWRARYPGRGLRVYWTWHLGAAQAGLRAREESIDCGCDVVDSTARAAALELPVDGAAPRGQQVDDQLRLAEAQSQAPPELHRQIGARPLVSWRN